MRAVASDYLVAQARCTRAMSSPSLSGSATESVGPFQFVILVLSVLTLGAIAADTFFTLPHEVSRILQGIDFIACALFFIDFVVRFRAAQSKLEFMKWGWIDLVASVPNVNFLRVGRFVRILRILRLLRGIRSLHRLFAILFVSRTRGGVTSVVMTAFLLVTFSSIAILFCETDPSSNIKTAGDAVWWSMTTVTTVGYGDRYPVTSAGRIVAAVLMIGGMGLFGTLSGIIASVFLGSGKEESAILVELREMRAELERLKTSTETARDQSSVPRKIR
jgi:voltage-gated potassium channel